MEFLNNHLFEIIAVGGCALVLLIILGKWGHGLIIRIIIGAIITGAVSAILLYIFHVPTDLVWKIGIIIFILGAIFGKLPNR